MTAPVSFFLLAVLLATVGKGSSIECQKCYSINTDCIGRITVCDPEFDACSSLVVETNTSPKTQKTINKGCTTQKQCTPGAISMNLGTGYQETGDSICCTTDRCNNASLTVPTRNKTLNGLRCPFCYAERYEKCKQEVINCTGGENRCFTRTAGGYKVTTINSVTTISYQITQQGCATESFCANIAKIGFVTSGNTLNFGTSEIKCRVASRSGTRKAPESTLIFLQALSGLLIMTSFYHCLF
ncbi:phospholipase A2 inhibitor and Ly6/PLAUR domain-containing protein-like [Heteronotia binoei]|uniref:phospholipase A2 inhibitor and Ly6/PLAUR domain-containing protein-like n=1 Tax=Heteronotia binoei TaxID=13085 RepID=UPI0029317C6E|nr:phospholipase A2 inhibitor and Ly6/PLAUR domain-containing protein-like [Heteronotia binoei]